MTLFRHIFTLVLLSSSFAFSSAHTSDDDAGTSAAHSSNNSVARSQSSTLSNPEDGYIDNRLASQDNRLASQDNRTAYYAAQAAQVTRAQTPPPSFAHLLPIATPYRGSVDSDCTHQITIPGTYHIRGTDTYAVLRSNGNIEIYHRESIE